MRSGMLLLLMGLVACGGDRERPAAAPADTSGAGAGERAPGGRVYVTVQADNAVATLDGAKWPAGAEPTHLDVSPDGRYIAVAATGEDRVYVLDAHNGAVIGTIAVGARPMGVRFAPWPGTLFVANEGAGTVGVASLRDGTVDKEIAVGERPRDMVIDAGRELMFVAVQGASAVAVIDLEMMTLAETVPVPGGPSSLVMSPDFSVFYLTLPDSREVIALDGARNVIGRVPAAGPEYGIDLSPDGRWLYVTGTGGSVLHVIEAATMTEVAQVEVGAGAHGVRTNIAGDEVYVAVGSTGEVVVVDALTRAVKRRVQVGGRPFWLAVH